MRKFKVGDQVLVTAGKDKGRKGKIIKVLANNYVVVKGVNLYKKHLKPREGQAGGIVEIERPLSPAKIMILTKDGQPTRVGFKLISTGKVRIAKKTGEEL